MSVNKITYARNKISIYNQGISKHALYLTTLYYVNYVLNVIIYMNTMILFKFSAKNV